MFYLKKFFFNHYVVFLIMMFFISGGKVQAKAVVGQTLKNVEILNVNDKKATIPFWGKKVLTIMYTDPDEKDVNDDLSDAISAKNYPISKYFGVGVANCKDTWIPNGLIRIKAKEKQKQYKKSKILLDEKKILSKAWGLGDCDDLGVVIIIGKDKKIKYIKKIKTKKESKSVIAEVLKIIEVELKKK